MNRQKADSCTILFMVILAGTVFSSCAKATFGPRGEINDLAPNSTIETLLSFSFEDITPYKRGDKWAYMAENVFSRPSGPAIVADVKAKHPNRSHPRILATQADFDRINENIKSDPLYKKWFAEVKASADQILTEPPFHKANRHVLQRRVWPLGLVYKMTGDTTYAERAWKEMEAYAKFEHWHPTTQFLDIAYITKGFAIGFDWTYDYLSPEQKNVIIEALSEKALKLVMVAYQNPTVLSPYQNTKTTGFDNWNSSINAGVMMASLALCDEANMEDLAGNVISNALMYWENYLKEFAPDGGCREGVGYWYWGVQSVVEGIASLESATGTDYGMGNAPGMASTAYFPFYMSGPKGAFNFGNAKSIFRICPEFYWFAKKYKDPKLAGIRKQFMDQHKTKAEAYDLLWYDESLVANQKQMDQLPLDMWFANTETSSLRSGWDENALFVALKGGDNMATHGHLNTGSFVLDALGQRWAVQLGGDRYGNPGYFTKGQRDSQGYQYYRVRAEGQNTILINPDTLSDQLPRAVSKVINFASSKDNAFSIIDMTPTYAHEANQVQRGLKLFDQRSKIVLRDEIRCKKQSEVWWFMHTPADISIDVSGKSATLTQNGQQLQVQLICSAKMARFSVREPVPLPTSPQTKRNNPNRGIKKLAVQLTGVKEVDISVVFTPETGQSTQGTQIEVKPLKHWN